MSAPDADRIVVSPPAATAGGRVNLISSGGPFGPGIPRVRISGLDSRLAFVSPGRLGVIVPDEVPGGHQQVEVEGFEGTAEILVGRPLVSGVHQVDNPAFDEQGNLYVTDSGSRGEEVPISIFRVSPDGTREPFVSGVVNATSMAFDRSGDLYVSSRFEGTVYRIRPDGTKELAASDLGVPCGLAFSRDGELLVGDRGGTIFAIEKSGRTRVLATLPASPAAFHLAVAPDGGIFVTAPTLGTYDPVFRIDAEGRVETYFTGFGRPQGLAFDRLARLHVCDALAGSSAVSRLDEGPTATAVASGTSLVGVAFDRGGHLAVCTNDTVYSLAP